VIETFYARLLNLPDLIPDETSSFHVTPEFSQRVRRYWLVLGCAQLFKARGGLFQLGIEAAEAQQRGCEVKLDDVTYYVGHESILHRQRGAALPRWQEALFAAMVRNAAHVTDYFRLPSEQVVEIGRQISI
jgi:hypothetical protein